MCLGRQEEASYAHILHRRKNVATFRHVYEKLQRNDDDGGSEGDFQDGEKTTL